MLGPECGYGPLGQLPAGARILLVSSEYHTRLPLAIFAARLISYHWSVAAASENTQFGMRWWRTGNGRKLWLGEWQKLLWWKLIERWFYRISAGRSSFGEPYSCVSRSRLPADIALVLLFGFLASQVTASQVTPCKRPGHDTN